MSLTAGSRLGPYEILEPLGAGGMGEVHKARDSRLERTVAIKVLPAALTANAELRQRLEREGRAVTRLNHPHICALYDIGHQDGVDFLVLELLEGETLASRLKKGALPLDLALRYATEMASALDHAHRHGIVHRDLKPGNVMLTKSGAKLLDFGLAKSRTPARFGPEEETATLTHDLTSQGTIVGTFQYMAPEQLEGKEADTRSDIFSFGAMLYEMVAGHRAFRGTSQASLISAILASDPSSLTPPDLDRVVRTCLAKDPDERWQSAGDLGRELKWMADGPVRGHAEPPRRPVAWIATALAAVLALLTISWVHFRERASEAQSIRFTIPTDARLPLGHQRDVADKQQVRRSAVGPGFFSFGENRPESPRRRSPYGKSSIGLQSCTGIRHCLRREMGQLPRRRPFAEEMPRPVRHRGRQDDGCPAEDHFGLRSRRSGDALSILRGPTVPNLGLSYDVTADGQRFLINAALDESRASPITIITHWRSGLRR